MRRYVSLTRSDGEVLTVGLPPSLVCAAVESDRQLRPGARYTVRRSGVLDLLACWALGVDPRSYTCRHGRDHSYLGPCGACGVTGCDDQEHDECSSCRDCDDAADAYYADGERRQREADEIEAAIMGGRDPDDYAEMDR